MKDTSPVRVNRRLINLGSTLLLAGVSCGWAAGPSEAWLQRIKAAPSGVVLAGGKTAADSVMVERVWKGKVCHATVRNTGAVPVMVQRVDLFDFKHGLPGDTPFYGESFQMLAQNIGTLREPRDMGSSYPDRKHYRLYEVPGLRTVRGMMVLRPAGADQILLGFASCRRFDGLLSFDAKRLVVSLDCEGLALAPGETWELEEFTCAASSSREALLDGLCGRIERNHPRRTGFKAPPLGWCSWYCFGPNVTVPDIRRNLDWIAANAPQLRYIQIDDGYQPWMGDWLESGKSFGGDIRAVLAEIRQRGFEPAIWLAPFIASPESKLFRDHSDWFVKDADGKPLRSDKVGFGGWRLGPWYALDGTHPEAQRFIENTFRTMRREWGCTYFKLDANYWGALNKGRFHDPKATRIEAYRRGMEAALRGAGDAFILGCNHPIWPSLGLVDGARVSNDLARNWTAVRDMARQSLLRGWQNGRFWWNDPDCALLHSGMLMDISGKMIGSQAMPWNEVIFHATAAHATGGLLLSGDDLPKLSPEELGVLRKLIPPTGRAASFADETLAIGRTPKKDGEYLYLFNWDDEPVDRVVSLPGRVTLKNYWTGELLGTFEGQYRVPALAPHSALLIESTMALENWQVADKRPPTESATKLKVGDPAPPLCVGKWIQGEPIQGFEKGKAYLLDFWATWCAGCVESIPHINSIHEKFKDKGLVVIGQCISKKDVEKVAPFVGKMGKKMTYRIALDDFSKSDRGAMAGSWHDAAGQNGIPVVFLVGKDGKLAWIGHPFGLLLNESIIKGVLDGSFDGVKVHAGPMGHVKRLQVGDPALPLSVGKWLKGQPVQSLEKGKAYLLDFWATWCPGCIESIPRLNAIQEKFRDKGLTVIGIDVGEPVASHFGKKTSPEAVAGKMAYRVAMDDIAGSKTGGGRMNETWMTQAEVEYIPAAFLVGKDGRIKYIGDPASLSDAVLESEIR